MKKNDLETANIFRRIVDTMIKSLLTVIGLLAYVVEIRPFLISLLGIYFTGFFDGIFVITIIVIIWRGTTVVIFLKITN